MTPLSSFEQSYSNQPPILCFDMDGTLLDEQECIHPADLQILAGTSTQAVFIPTTGRPLESVQRTFQRNGLYREESIPLPLVLLNGSLTYAGGGKLAGYHPFEMGVQSELLILARTHPAVTFMFLGQGPAHMLKPSPFGWSIARRYECTTQEFSCASSEIPFSKVMCLSEDPSLLEPLNHDLEGFPVERAFSVPFSLELTPRGVNKGSGLRGLLASLGLSDNPLLAAGDGGNDLPLREMAQAFFVPLSAPEEVRKHASHAVDVARTGLLGPMLACVSGMDL